MKRTMVVAVVVLVLASVAWAVTFPVPGHVYVYSPIGRYTDSLDLVCPENTDYVANSGHITGSWFLFAATVNTYQLGNGYHIDIEANYPFWITANIEITCQY